MRTLTRRAVAVAAALAAVAPVGLISTTASALPAGTAADTSPSLALSPGTGNQASFFNLSFSAAAFCQGDTAGGGYNWSSFFVASTVDPATLIYTGSGPSIGAGGGSGYISTLYDLAGDNVLNRNTAAATASGGQINLAGGNSYQIIPNTAAGIPNGSYRMGIACHASTATAAPSVVNGTTRYWSIPVTISGSSGTNFNYGFGAAPSAPALDPLGVSTTTLSGTFTTAPAIPALTALAVLVTPTAGGTTVTQALAANATSFAVTGLSPTTQYDVQVRATNSVGETLSNLRTATTGTASSGGVTAEGVGTTQIVSLDAGPAAVAPPSGVVFPNGQVAFTANTQGPTAVVQLTLPSQPTNIYKLIGTAWVDITTNTNLATAPTVVIAGNVVTVTLQDNAAYDSNPAVGVVTDPIAGAVVATGGVTGLSASGGPLEVSLTWAAPAAAGRTGYTVDAAVAAGAGANPCSSTGTVIDLDPATAGTTAVLPASATSYTASGLAANTTYCFTVTPTYPAPAVGASATVPGTANGLATLIQTISVERPLGTLVLTQVCGVSGPLPAEAGVANQFPKALVAVGGTTTANGFTGPTAPDFGTGTDPNYPANYPGGTGVVTTAGANYPTNCGVDLGTGELIDDPNSPLEGLYFVASGRLNQVTVTQTSNVDVEWAVTGTMGTFRRNGTGTGQDNSFPGSYLGWTPVVSDRSSSGTNGELFLPTVGEAGGQFLVPGVTLTDPDGDGTTPQSWNYRQNVVSGAAVQPDIQATTTLINRSGGPGPETSAGRGLGVSRTLARVLDVDGSYTDADTNNQVGGLGIAKLDARLKLLIPVSADAGTYSGVLTLTVI